jgi:hypothetical protein
VKFLRSARNYARLAQDILDDDLDFSPVIITLGKAFEYEANLSLAQWARQLLGIRLPDYFALHQPGVVAHLTLTTSTTEIVDFNAKRDGRWLPPGMGKTRIALMRLTTDGPPPCFDADADRGEGGWDRILREWRLLQQLRNQAAHTEFIQADTIGELERIYQSLADAGAFDGMYRLKSTLRGDVV